MNDDKQHDDTDLDATIAAGDDVIAGPKAIAGMTRRRYLETLDGTPLAEDLVLGPPPAAKQE